MVLSRFGGGTVAPDGVTGSGVDRRHALRLLGGLGLAGTMAGPLAACSSSDSSSPYAHLPATIGLLLPQTGERKLIGDELKNGFNLYLEQHDGQLGGHPITITTADEG